MKDTGDAVDGGSQSYISLLMLSMMITGFAQPVVTSSYKIVERIEYLPTQSTEHKPTASRVRRKKAKENPPGTHVMAMNDDEAEQINRSCQGAVGVLGRINVPPHGDQVNVPVDMTLVPVVRERRSACTFC